ncbi:hypothetical protein KIK06_26455 [Nocardiopsis sp. EMB25]|uniref:hypothetical protein n=1 Tax=Nocardiopsis sp. EMB25 TaxID=2835867 RepID=UPI002283E432|nr:hypothetical protein [Nocardiopsis sp. EMB25]MCY9787428.1 hypothetical protein [Nocardiopsis sp. EMB25]
MSTHTRGWFCAAAMAAAPVLLLALLLYHPVLAGVTVTPEAVTGALEADPARWAAVHMLAVGLLALFVLAFQGLRGLLRDAGEQRWSSLAFPLVVVANVGIAALAGMQVAVAAAIPTGAGTLALVRAVQPWYLTLAVVAAVAFLLGALAFAAGVVRAGFMGRTTTAVVAVALVVAGLAAVTPIFAASYVLVVAAFVAFWPLAWTTVRTEATAQAGPEPGESEKPIAPRPRAAERHKGTLRSLGRRGSHAQH